MKKLYYYKIGCGDWIFAPNLCMSNDRDAITNLIKHRKEGYVAWRLYLDQPDDFELIKKMFFTPEYWENKTWQEEFNKQGRKYE